MISSSFGRSLLRIPKGFSSNWRIKLAHILFAIYILIWNSFAALFIIALLSMASATAPQGSNKFAYDLYKVNHPNSQMGIQAKPGVSE